MRLLPMLGVLITLLPVGCSLTLEDIKFDDASQDGASTTGDSSTGDSSMIGDTLVDGTSLDGMPHDVSRNDARSDGTTGDTVNVPDALPPTDAIDDDAPIACALQCVTDTDCQSCASASGAMYCCVRGTCVADIACTTTPLDAITIDATGDTGVVCAAQECDTTQASSCGASLVCCPNSGGSGACGTCQTSCSAMCDHGACTAGDSNACSSVARSAVPARAESWPAGRARISVPS